MKIDYHFYLKKNGQLANVNNVEFANGNHLFL